MKRLKVTIELDIKGDIEDTETIKEDVYQQLQELMEEGDLNYEVIDPENEDLEDEYEVF